MTITAVLWDADGVLQHARPGWRETMIGFGGEGFIDAVNDAERGPLAGHGSFRTAIAELVRQRELTVDAGQVLALWEQIDVDPGAMLLVKTLRKQGIRCYLATNQHDERTSFMRTELRYGDHLDGQFYSSEMGVAKPSPAFFEHILADLALPAAQVLFIDDLAENVAGAAAVGLSAAIHHPASGAAGVRRILADYRLLVDDSPLRPRP
ncbi:MAG: HAD-IA family hydrolase [Nakamurella sp.]